MLTKKSGLVDWTKRADEIERMIRGLSPWPSAYTFEHGKMLKIWKAEVVRPATDGEAVSGREQEKMNPEAVRKLFRSCACINRIQFSRPSWIAGTRMRTVSGRERSSG